MNPKRLVPVGVAVLAVALASATLWLARPDSGDVVVQEAITERPGRTTRPEVAVAGEARPRAAPEVAGPPENPVDAADWPKQRRAAAAKWRVMSLDEARDFSDVVGLPTTVHEELLEIIERHHADRAATALAIENGTVRMPDAREELRSLQLAFDEELEMLLGSDLAESLNDRLIAAATRAMAEAAAP